MISWSLQFIFKSNVNRRLSYISSYTSFLALFCSYGNIISQPTTLSGSWAFFSCKILKEKWARTAQVCVKIDWVKVWWVDMGSVNSCPLLGGGCPWLGGLVSFFLTPPDKAWKVRGCKKSNLDWRALSSLGVLRSCQEILQKIRSIYSVIAYEKFILHSMTPWFKIAYVPIENGTRRRILLVVWDIFKEIDYLKQT